MGELVLGMRARWRATPRWMRLAVLGALTVLLVAGLLLRWPAVGPMGSDNDEYREVARAIARGDGPVTGGGVEATKYPLGYPLLLAGLQLLRLPVTGAALLLNVVALLAVVGLLATTLLRPATLADGGRPAPSATVLLAAAAAVVFCLANVTVWEMVGQTMPDLLALAASFALIAVAAAPPSGRRVVGLTAVVVVGLALKSLAVLLVPAAMVALLADRGDGGTRWRRLFWLPAAAGVVVLLLGALAVAGLPEHTTGYGATFLLRNPGDASLGQVGVGGLAARLFTRLDVVATVAGKSVIGPAYATWWTWPVTAGLVVTAIVGLRRLRPVLATWTVTYVVLLALWPYQSTRLSSPILPVAVLGVAVVVARLGRAAFRVARPQRVPFAAAVGVVAILTVFAAANLVEVGRASDRRAAAEAAIARDLDAAADWLEEHAGQDPAIVSFDYREVAYRFDRVVLPLGYTSDMDVLVAASAGAGAQWLVVVDAFAPARVVLAEQLTRQHPELFTRVLDTPTVDLFRVLGTPGPSS